MAEPSPTGVRSEPRSDRAAGRAVATVAVVLLVVLPLVGLGLRAFADVWRAPALLPQTLGLRGVRALDLRLLTAIVNSAVVAVATTGAAVLLAWPAARAIGERRVRHPTLVLLVLALPLLVPPYAVGTGLLTWFLRLGLTDHLAGLVLAHLVFVLPYVVLLLVPAFTRDVRALEEAASVLGTRPARRLLAVTLPAVRRHLSAAVLLGFIVSWSQYGTSLAVGGGIPMLPLVLVPHVGTDPQIAAVLALIFLAPALLAVVAVVAIAWAGRGGR